MVDLVSDRIPSCLERGWSSERQQKKQMNERAPRGDDVWRDSARRIRDSIVLSLLEQMPCNVAGDPLAGRELSGMGGRIGLSTEASFGCVHRDTAEHTGAAFG